MRFDLGSSAVMGSAAALDFTFLGSGAVLDCTRSKSVVHIDQRTWKVSKITERMATATNCHAAASGRHTSVIPTGRLVDVRNMRRVLRE